MARVYQHTSRETLLRRNWSTAVPEGNRPAPQQDELGPDPPKLVDLYRMNEELFGKSDRKLDELADEMGATKQCLAGPKQDARHLRLAMGADVPSDTKTRERTEGAAAAVQVKHGDSCYPNWVDPDPMCLTRFGDDSTGPPALPCSRDNASVGNGATAPKSCLSPLEMRTPTAAGDLLPAGTASTATRTAFDKHLLGSVRPNIFI